MKGQIPGKFMKAVVLLNFVLIALLSESCDSGIGPDETARLEPRLTFVIPVAG